MSIVISALKARQTAIAVCIAVFHVAGWVGMATNNSPAAVAWIQSVCGENTSPDQVGLLVGDWFDAMCNKILLLTGTIALVAPSVWKHIVDFCAKFGVAFTKALGLVGAGLLIVGCTHTLAGAGKDAAAGKQIVNTAANQIREVSSSTLALLGAPLRGPAPAVATPTPTPAPLPASVLSVKTYKALEK